ncbi:MAG: acyl-CoA dehydrogenase family protein, partial [Gemmatimonadaceae bacterium]
MAATTELRDRVRAFVTERVIPLESECLRAPFRSVEPRLHALRDEARALGLWAPHLPTSLGGLGLQLQEFAVLSEELGRTPYGHYTLNCQAPDVGNMELLAAHGTPEQRERWLTPLARGEIRSCFAMTEPGRAGSNPVWL